jgi:hypothetical protein
MKFSLVQMRTPAPLSPATSRGGVGRPPAGSPVRQPRDAAATCPRGAEAASWAALVRRVDETQAGLAIANAPLRAAARAVVRELRASGVTWDSVYTTLDTAGVQEPVREVRYALELEIYATRGASIVAHMHCWADVERLAELEAGGTD